MDSLNTILNSGTYGENVSRHNDNNSKIKQAITTLENVAIANKGYFDTLASLQAAFPSPKSGNIAYVANVASSTGYYIYNVVSGVWTATTTEAPAVGVAISNYAQHGYSSSPKTLKQVDDEIVQLAGDIRGDVFSIRGYYLNQNGSLATYLNSKVTPFLMLNKDEDLVINGTETASQRVCAFYDKYKEVISVHYTGENNGSGEYIISKDEFPVEAVYFRANSDISFTDASISPFSLTEINENTLDKNISISTMNDGLFDKEKSSNLSHLIKASELLDDIVICNPDITASYTLSGIGKTVININKNGSLCASIALASDGTSKWFYSRPAANNSGECVIVRVNPDNLPTTVYALSGLVISKYRYIDIKDMDINEIVNRRLYDNLFNNPFPEGRKFTLSSAIKELYIQGYDNTQAYLGFISNNGPTCEVRIQDISGNNLFAYNGIKKPIIFISNDAGLSVIVVDWNKITEYHSLMNTDVYRLNERCFNLAYNPIANSYIAQTFTQVKYTGNVFPDFSNPAALTDKNGETWIEFYQANGVGLIEYNAELSKNVYTQYSNKGIIWSPILTLKVSNVLRKGFEGNDKWRVRGKIYIDNGDAVAPDLNNLTANVAFKRASLYPSGTDTFQNSRNITGIANKTWTDFEVNNIVGVYENAEYVAFTITQSGTTTTVSQERRISLANITVDFFKEDVNISEAALNVDTIYQKQDIVNAVISSLKADRTFIEELQLNALKTYNRSADVFFNKIRSLVSQTEIQYLAESQRLPSQSKSAIMLQDDVLYYFHKGKRYSINLTEASNDFDVIK